MKNLTHYFQVSKSPPDEPVSGSSAVVEESSNTQQKAEEDLVKVSKKCTPKPKKSTPKSKKNQLESESAEKCNPKSSVAVSPDSTVNTSGKKKRGKRNEINETTPEKDIKANSPQKSFANSMQDILQRVLKKKFPHSSDGEDSSDKPNNKDCDNVSDSVMLDSGELEILDEISSSVTPKPKKRGRKPKGSKDESNDSSSDKGKLSYEELENELIRERLLLAKLKETFLASNPDAESLAKYNNTLGPKKRINLNSSLEIGELPSTPKAGKNKLSNGVASGSKSTGNKPVSPKKPLWTPKSLAKSAMKNSEVPKKSSLAKNTPEDSTKIMKEVLEHLDHSESKTVTPSPRKSPPKSKSTLSKDNTETKSKKHLKFTEVGNEEENGEKIKKKNKKGGDEPEEILPLEIKKKTGNSPKKPVIKEKKTESPAQKKRQRKKKGESGDTMEKLHVSNSASPVKKNVKISLDNEERISKQEKKMESPADQKRKRKKRSESTDDIEELLSPVPISAGKKRKKNAKHIDSDEEQVSGPDKKTESLSEKKRKRRKTSESANSVENLPVPSEKKNLKNCLDGSDKAEVLEQSSPAKKTKMNPKKKEVKKVTEKKKVTDRRSSGDNKKPRKNSLSKKSDTNAKSSMIKIDKTQKKETVDLDSSSDSVFVVSSQKAKDIDNATQKTPKSKSKSESESTEKKISKVDSIETDSSQKNSLLNYFGKVDKIYLKKEEKSTSLTTQAIIHSPPLSPSRKRKSASGPFSPRRKKLKSMLADADKIELLSSEIISNTNSDEPNDVDSQNEAEKSDVSPGPSKLSPKKWSMRVKLAVQSPSKSSTAGEGSSSVVHESPDGESSPDKKVKRKLFGSKPKPSAEKSNESNNCDSTDVQVIEEESEGNANQKKMKKSASTVKCKEVAKSTPTSKENETPKPPVKLASIFLKKSTPKTNTGTADSPIVIDEESLKAKKDFLSSGVPDIIKQKSEQSKASEKLEEEEFFVPFPKISHVGYDNLNSSSNPLSQLEKLFGLRPTTIPTEIVCDCLKKSWENIIEPASQVSGTTDIHRWMQCNDIKRQQRYLKKQASNFPFDVFEKKFENISSEQNSVDKNQEMWTEKYKPQCSKEVIGNGACISSLKQWLEEQKASKKKDSDGSSGDEFVSSDDDSSLSYRANNVAILTGPPGCGKTSSVYAVAKELGCKVLELNASYDRNGKKILAELLEATQSHQVKQVSSILADMFSKGNKKSDKKKKKKELKKKLKSTAQDPESKVMSIILIEDADLIFSEHDDGFVSALFSLSTLSKRPIILVANNVQSAHLSKFIKQQCLLLEYNKPSFADIKTWLQLIALYEAVELPSSAAEKIVYETTDMRQAILNLQYHLRSTLKPRIMSNVDWPLDVGKLWWQWPSPFMLPPLSIPTVKQSKPIVLENSDERLQDSNESIADPPSKPVVPSLEDRLKFHKLASFIDSVALAEVWSSSRYYTIHSEDPSPKSWRVKAEDSCLLNERNSLEHAGYDSILVALSHELISRHVRELDLKFENCIQNRLSPDLDRWKKKHKKVEKILLTGLPLLEQIDRGSVFCDYLPMIRCISRSECLRLAGNSKRSNRFFNYLSSLNMHPDERQRTLMCNSLISYNETVANS